MDILSLISIVLVIIIIVRIVFVDRHQLIVKTLRSRVMKKFDISVLGLYNKFNLPEALLLTNECFSFYKDSTLLFIIFMNYI